MEEIKKEVKENFQEEIEQEETKQEETEQEEIEQEETEQEETEPVLPEMNVVAEVETTYDYKALKYCNMYILKVKRKSIVVYSVMIAVCIAIAIYLFLKGQGNGKLMSIIPLALAVWVLWSIFTEESKVDKSLQTFFRTNAPFKQRFAFDHERIRVTALIDGETKQADYLWPYVQEIHMLPEYFIMFLNGGTPIIIDRDPEKLLVGTKEDLEQIIREQSALKPFKSYDKPLVKKMIDITYINTIEDLDNNVIEEDEQITEELDSIESSNEEPSNEEPSSEDNK